MKNGARYAVKTHWGTFSLDEGSYQDYLTGRLWICWKAGSPEQQIASAKHTPDNRYDYAIVLRDNADKTGVLSMLCKLGIHEV